MGWRAPVCDWLDWHLQPFLNVNLSRKPTLRIKEAIRNLTAGDPIAVSARAAGRPLEARLGLRAAYSLLASRLSVGGGGGVIATGHARTPHTLTHPGGKSCMQCLTSVSY